MEPDRDKYKLKQKRADEDARQRARNRLEVARVKAALELTIATKRAELSKALADYAQAKSNGWKLDTPTGEPK